MKNFYRILSLLICVLLCFGLFAACGEQESANDEPTLVSTEAPTDAKDTEPVNDETKPFVAPPDVLGLVVSADAELLTWNLYVTQDETIDFMKVDVKALGEAAAEMSLYYLEDDVSFFRIKDGKIVEAFVEEIVTGTVLGVTTLEEGVQEVYILYIPGEDDSFEDADDLVGDTIDEVVEVTTPTEETPDQEPGEGLGQD